MSQHRASVPPAAEGTAEGPGRPDSTGELVQRLSHDVTRLVKDELRLAQLEVTGKAKRAGIGAGMFGAAGLFGFFAFAALTACFIGALSLIFDEVWPAALIVAVVYGAIAGVLAMRGKDKLTEATPPIPQTTETVKEDVAWAKTLK